MNSTTFRLNERPYPRVLEFKLTEKVGNGRVSVTGRRVGYIRVNRHDQKTFRQLDGVVLDRAFTDHASGKNQNRPALEYLIGFVRDGDTVIIHSMDRLTRNLEDLRSIACRLTEKKVRIEFVHENLLLTGEDNAIATLLLNVTGAFA